MSALGSQVLEFRPGSVTPGNYRFAVGTAGSASLVLPLAIRFEREDQLRWRATVGAR